MRVVCLSTFVHTYWNLGVLDLSQQTSLEYDDFTLGVGGTKHTVISPMKKTQYFRTLRLTWVSGKRVFFS